MGGKAGIILVLGFAFILGYMSLNLSSSATSSVQNMARYNQTTVSHNIAVAGANVGLSQLYADTTWRGPVTQSAGGAFPGGYTVQATPIAGDQLLVQSISRYQIPGYKTFRDTVEVYLNRKRLNSFTLFAWMTNFEGNVFWITSDTVWGRVHSNGALHVNGKPVFMEKVTTSKGFDPKVGTETNSAIFKQGYETGVAEIDFPADLSDLVAAATVGGGGKVGRSYLLPDVWITMDPGTAANNDGKVYVRATKGGAIIDSIALNDPTFNGAILGSGNVHVEGTLDGKATIASLSQVTIENDVLYEKDPMVVPTSDDLLGLVSENNIIVADNAPNNSNCIVQASVFTRTGAFSAENFNTRPVAGELRLLGSMVQEQRGAVGTFSGSTIKSGFSKRYRYDTRLSDPAFRPPFYPGFYVRTLAIKNWWESYRIEGLGNF